MIRLRPLLSCLALVGVTVPLDAPMRAAPPADQFANPEYNGRFSFTRIQYFGGGGFRGRGGSSWAHDWPDGDINMQSILDEVTALEVNLGRSNVFTLDDPAIFQNPIIYISEPGYWRMSEAEVVGLRTYLLKGGFVIFDDFEENQWYNFEEQLMRALPEYELIELPFTHPIFDSFFHMENVDVPHPLVSGITPHYYGVFEDNDPAGRMMVMVNFNNDLAEYWEFSGRGYFPMDLTNDAWRLGVNYIIYGLTH
jgi:hypothetical protein